MRTKQIQADNARCEEVARDVAGDALSLVTLTRRRVERAVLETQRAIAELEDEAAVPSPRQLERVARTLREALANLDRVPREVTAAVVFAARRGLEDEIVLPGDAP